MRYLKEAIIWTWLIGLTISVVANSLDIEALQEALAVLDSEIINYLMGRGG